MHSTMNVECMTIKVRGVKTGTIVRHGRSASFEFVLSPKPRTNCVLALIFESAQITRFIVALLRTLYSRVLYCMYLQFTPQHAAPPKCLDKRVILCIPF